MAPKVDTAPGLVTTAAFFATTAGPLPGLPNPLHVAVQPPTFFQGIEVPTADFVSGAHGNGLSVHVWLDSKDEETNATYARLVDNGVDGIMTDTPSRLEPFLAAAPRALGRALARAGAFSRLWPSNWTKGRSEGEKALRGCPISLWGARPYIRSRALFLRPPTAPGTTSDLLAGDGPPAGRPGAGRDGLTDRAQLSQRAAPQAPPVPQGKEAPQCPPIR